jgi:hypothetical protein
MIKITGAGHHLSCHVLEEQRNRGSLGAESFRTWVSSKVTAVRNPSMKTYRGNTRIISVLNLTLHEGERSAVVCRLSLCLQSMSPSTHRRVWCECPERVWRSPRAPLHLPVAWPLCRRMNHDCYRVSRSTEQRRCWEMHGCSPIQQILSLLSILSMGFVQHLLFSVTALLPANTCRTQFTWCLSGLLYEDASRSSFQNIVLISSIRVNGESPQTD